MTENTVVYLDGSGKTPGAYRTLAAAAAALPEGGTVIVSGNTDVMNNEVMPNCGALYITSIFGDEDYTAVASLKFYSNLSLGADTSFENIVFERVAFGGGDIYIAACGNKLEIGEGVVCLNYTGKHFLSLVGGVLDSSYKGDSRISVKSGYFHNVLGGNLNGSFFGNSRLDISGGCFDNVVAGGCKNGDFNGNSYLNFGGDASFLFSSSALGIVGGNVGSEYKGRSCFTGNSYITLSGNCGVNHNVTGASRGKYTYFRGNVEIRVKDKAHCFYSVYAGGFYNGTDGNTKVILRGGSVDGSVFGGSKHGIVEGDTYVEINSGNHCFFGVNSFSSNSPVAGTKNIYAGGGEGSVVCGNALVAVLGGSVYGNIYAKKEYNGSVIKGRAAARICAGTVFGSVRSDNTLIDLGSGKGVTLGVSSSVDTVIGGGTLALYPECTVTANKLVGEVKLEINGIPLPRKYLDVNTDADGDVVLNDTNGCYLVKDGGAYSVDFAGACKEVKATVNFKSGFKCSLCRGGVGSEEYITPASTSEISEIYYVTPGLYTATVTNEDNVKNYKREAVYVNGRTDEVNVDLEFDKADPDGFDYLRASFHSPEMLDKHYNVSDIAGYSQPDTPYFNKRYGRSSVYTTNTELCDFVAKKAEKCDYMHVYSLGTTPMGYDLPCVLFSKDDIPDKATVEQAAETVRSKGVRDILMINAGTHGNEPTGTEGNLAFISEMCGEYGKKLLENRSIGAVIVIPRVNPDGFKEWKRETPNGGPVINLNRDYFRLSSAEVAGVVRVHRLFKPTFTLDCHEALANPKWSDARFLTDTYDAGIKFFCGFNSPLADPLSVIKGNRGAVILLGDKIASEVMDDLSSIGLRPYYYPKTVGSVMNTNSSGVAGAFSYLLEIPGITGGESFFGRRTFSQLSAIKAFVAAVNGMNGEMARIVCKNREELSEKVEKAPSRLPVVLQSGFSGCSPALLSWNNPLIGADTETAVKDNPTYTYNLDCAMKYRSLPSAYVIPADISGINNVLDLLDKHFIEYEKLPCGTELPLEQYCGTVKDASLCPKRNVFFENGAYLIPVKGYLTYVIALLFEPDNIDAGVCFCSIAQCGFIEVSDIYRSTEKLR